MSQYDMGKLGVVAPLKCKEGDISIDTINSAHGDIKGPKVASPLAKGDWVELDGDMTVKKLTTSGVRLGRVANTPKWETVEPTTGYTQAQAVSADLLREAGIETIFTKILTVDVTGTVAAGNYLVDDSTTAGNFKQSASSGTTASDVIALTEKDSNNQVIAGFK